MGFKGSIQGIIFDIDGVLEYQGRAYPGAAETVAALRARGLALRFLTNSTLKSRVSCAEKLRGRGIWVDKGEVITASSATAAYLEGLKPRSIWVMLEREGLDEFRGFVHDDQEPEYVVIGDNRSRFDFEHLNHALRLLARGAKLVGMQAELVDSSMGELELNVGSWAGMLERAAGVQAVYLGKPNPFVFDLALNGMEVPRESVLVVGDRVQTDVAGAKAAGLRSALVRSGEYRPGDELYGPAPDILIDALEELVNLV